MGVEGLHLGGCNPAWKMKAICQTLHEFPIVLSKRL